MVKSFGKLYQPQVFAFGITPPTQSYLRLLEIEITGFRHWTRFLTCPRPLFIYQEGREYWLSVFFLWFTVPKNFLVAPKNHEISCVSFNSAPQPRFFGVSMRLYTDFLCLNAFFGGFFKTSNENQENLDQNLKNFRNSPKKHAVLARIGIPWNSNKTLGENNEIPDSLVYYSTARVGPRSWTGASLVWLCGSCGDVMPITRVPYGPPPPRYS